MAVYNTSSDAANTAVRAFLTEVGEFYLKQSFNTGSGSGKKTWEKIKTEDFNSCCAYCDVPSKSLQIEHVIMFNRSEYGLHHPGNIIPCCKECNKRGRAGDKHVHWEVHLRNICERRDELDLFEYRKQRILNHINLSKFKYPEFEDAEKNAIRVIAESLYANVKLEIEKSISLYKELDKAFVKLEKEI